MTCLSHCALNLAISFFVAKFSSGFCVEVVEGGGFWLSESIREESLLTFMPLAGGTTPVGEEHTQGHEVMTRADEHRQYMIISVLQ